MAQLLVLATPHTAQQTPSEPASKIKHDYVIMPRVLLLWFNIFISASAMTQTGHCGALLKSGPQSKRRGQVSRAYEFFFKKNVETYQVFDYSRQWIGNISYHWWDSILSPLQTGEYKSCWPDLKHSAVWRGNWVRGKKVIRWSSRKLRIEPWEKQITCANNHES